MLIHHHHQKTNHLQQVVHQVDQVNQVNQINVQIYHQNQQQNHQYHQITITMHFHLIKMVINKINKKMMVIKIKKY